MQHIIYVVGRCVPQTQSNPPMLSSHCCSMLHILASSEADPLKTSRLWAGTLPRHAVVGAWRARSPQARGCFGNGLGDYAAVRRAVGRAYTSAPRTLSLSGTGQHLRPLQSQLACALHARNRRLSHSSVVFRMHIGVQLHKALLHCQRFVISWQPGCSPLTGELHVPLHSHVLE